MSSACLPAWLRYLIKTPLALINSCASRHHQQQPHSSQPAVQVSSPLRLLLLVHSTLPSVREISNGMNAGCVCACRYGLPKDYLFFWRLTFLFSCNTFFRTLHTFYHQLEKSRLIPAPPPADRYFWRLPMGCDLSTTYLQQCMLLVFREL